MVAVTEAAFVNPQLVAFVSYNAYLHRPRFLVRVVAYLALAAYPASVDRAAVAFHIKVIKKWLIFAEIYEFFRVYVIFALKNSSHVIGGILPAHS